MVNPKTATDEELVQLIRTQDQELYREIVHRYQDKLLRYATCLTQNEGRAADVTQEAFIKAFINLNGFDTGKKFSSWIYRIVHNEAINSLKKYGRETSLESSREASNLPTNDGDIQEDLNRELLKKAAAACLDKLPLAYRSPLALFYLEGRSYEEISDVLRIPIGTVGTHINRGKKMLAEIWRRSCGR